MCLFCSLTVPSATIRMICKLFQMARVFHLCCLLFSSSNPILAALCSETRPGALAPLWGAGCSCTGASASPWPGTVNLALSRMRLVSSPDLRRPEGGGAGTAGGMNCKPDVLRVAGPQPTRQRPSYLDAVFRCPDACVTAWTQRWCSGVRAQ